MFRDFGHLRSRTREPCALLPTFLEIFVYSIRNHYPSGFGTQPAFRKTRYFAFELSLETDRMRTGNDFNGNSLEFCLFILSLCVSGSYQAYGQGAAEMAGANSVAAAGLTQP